MILPSLKFTMPLPKAPSSEFIEGVLCGHEDDVPAFKVRATSGLVGCQYQGHWWQRGHSPIPPSSVLDLGDYEVRTAPIATTVSKKVAMGSTHLRILPDPIRGPNGAIRTEILLHYDGAGAGTAGCVGVRPRKTATEPGWYVVLGWILHLRENHGISSIPLHVEYPIV